MPTRPSNALLDQVGHYETNPNLPLLFYGGLFSNFVGTAMTITAPQPWSPEPVTASYWTVEHFYQASKCLRAEQHAVVRAERNCWACKQLGQKVDIRPRWDEGVSFEYMLRGLRAKFSAGSPNAVLLMQTRDRFIAEDSPTDAIWGLRSTEPSAFDVRVVWDGRNWLGIALMVRRAELQGKSLNEITVDVIGPTCREGDADLLAHATAVYWRG